MLNLLLNMRYSLDSGAPATHLSPSWTCLDQMKLQWFACPTPLQFRFWIHQLYWLAFWATYALVWWWRLWAVSTCSLFAFRLGDPPETASISRWKFPYLYSNSQIYSCKAPKPARWYRASENLYSGHPLLLSFSFSHLFTHADFSLLSSSGSRWLACNYFYWAISFWLSER